MVGAPELLLILGAALLLFGPNKLPEVAKSLGEATRQYKDGLSNAKREIASQTTELSDLSPQDRKLVLVAKKLGIPTEGRSIDEIAQDILNHPDTV